MVCRSLTENGGKTMTDKQQPEKMTGESLDISEQRRNELKQLFPGVFTETTGTDGQPVEAIDFERLKAELGGFSDVYVGRRERYGMEWPGKRDCMKLIQEPSRATLKPCREESVDFDTTQNLFIEGDNLEVLKLLQKSYYGKVKMIYIDPPYNTGKEFIYPDNYTESLETYLAYAGLIDNEGKKFSTNTATEGRFHTKWLNMMYPRLYLARNLLRKDGVIFISIDDNEVENLRRICDEIFGEENFLSQIIIQSNKRGQTYKEIAKCHEYLLIYYNSDLSTLGELEKDSNSLPFEDEYGCYELWELRNRNPKFGRHNRPNLFYPIYVNPSSVNDVGLAEISLVRSSVFCFEVFPRNSKGEDSCWRWSNEKLTKDSIDADPITVFAKQRRDGEWNIYEKSRKNTKKAKSIWVDNAVISEQGTVESGKLDMAGMLEFPKPIELIKRCIKLGTIDGDIILDYFAGSGTTANAVMAQCREDGHMRSSISVQLPEPCGEETKAYQSGLENIAEICKERIRRAAKIIHEEREAQLDLEGKYKLDLGFKVLKLDKSNFKQWQSFPEGLDVGQLSEQLVLHTDYIDHEVSQEDILYELLLKAGFMPTERIETLTLADKQVFSIAEGALLICLEEELTSELIDAVADREPMQFICLDKGFKGNDQLKANAVQTFKSRSRSAEAEMVFRVV